MDELDKGITFLLFSPVLLQNMLSVAYVENQQFSVAKYTYKNRTGPKQVKGIGKTFLYDHKFILGNYLLYYFNIHLFNNNNFISLRVSNPNSL